MSNILGGIQNGQQGISGAGETKGEALVGNWRGNAVSLVQSEKSLFTSALEEMSFARAERKEKDLSKRKISDTPQEKQRALGLALAHLENTDELHDEKQLKPFLIELMRQAELSEDELGRLSEEHFSDSTQRFIALTYAREQLLSKTDSPTIKLLSTINKVLDGLIEQEGVGIRAGLNIAPITQEYAGQSLQSVPELRKFYQDSVLDYGNLASTYRKIIERYGSAQYSQSVSFLISALGADLASEGPSVPKERLRLVVDDLFKLQSLCSLEDECQELLNQLHRVYVQLSFPEKAQLMGGLLELLDEKWMDAGKVEKLLPSLSIKDEAAIFFLQGFKEMVRLLPHKTYQDQFERDKLLGCIQECLDHRIELEHTRTDEE